VSSTHVRELNIYLLIPRPSENFNLKGVIRIRALQSFYCPDPTCQRQKKSKGVSWTQALQPIFLLLYFQPTPSLSSHIPSPSFTSFDFSLHTPSSQTLNTLKFTKIFPTNPLFNSFHQFSYTISLYSPLIFALKPFSSLTIQISIKIRF
jgi:hypothetical protein